MFERFTTEARDVVVGAQAQAAGSGTASSEPSTCCSALAASEGQTAALLRARGITPAAWSGRPPAAGRAPRLQPLDREALAAIGIDLDQVLGRIEAAFGPHALGPIRTQRRRRWRRSRSCANRARAGPPLHPRAKKCLELSLREAIALRDGHIGTEHLALGLTRMNEGMSAQILAALGVSARALHAELLDRHRWAG